jgi:hypothetical protein
VERPDDAGLMSVRAYQKRPEREMQMVLASPPFLTDGPLNGNEGDVHRTLVRW